MSEIKIDKSPASMEVNGVKGLALQPFSTPDEDLLSAVRGLKKALFIDLAATPQMQQVMDALEGEGIEIAGYRDHHYAPDSTDERDQKTTASADQIKEKLGDGARFDLRENTPSCARLVDLGEAVRNKIDLILHHGDTDGFLGYLKACGVTYEGMEQDADIIDSRGDENKLTEHGRLYLDSLASLPPFNPKRPDILNKAKQVLQEEFLAYIEGNFAEEVAAPLKERAKVALEVVQTTKELLELVEILEGGIAFVDTTVVGNRKYNPIELSNGMAKPEGIRITAQKKNFGPLAKDGCAQVSISRLPSDKTTDLRDYLPEGAESGIEHGRIFNTPFLLHLREDLFDDFVEHFNKGKEIIPGINNNILRETLEKDLGLDQQEIVNLLTKQDDADIQKMTKSAIRRVWENNPEWGQQIIDEVLTKLGIRKIIKF